DRAYVGRNQAVQFPFVGSGLRGAGLPGHPVARLRAGGPAFGHRGIQGPSAPLRRSSLGPGRSGEGGLMALRVRDIGLRAASALVLAPGAILATWAGGWWFAGLIAAACILLAREWALMSARGAHRSMW